MQPPPGISLRSAVPGDTAAILGLLSEGFETYRTFAGDGWQPPVPDEPERMAISALLARDEVWFVVAEDGSGGGALAGQCGFHPATRERAMRGEAVPGMVQLWQLFIREDWWGRGLAPYLHDLALGEMRRRGYACARLHTPAGQARARRFYEKRGWLVADEISVANPPNLAGLAMVEYRIDLD